MPQRDKYHQVVREALEKAGWTIVHDPMMVLIDATRVYIDLAAEKTQGASRIGIEVKVFESAKFLQEFAGAIGQYIIYRGLLELYHPERELYLAIPNDVYFQRMRGRDIQYIFSRNHIHLLLYDAKKKEIAQWIQQPPTRP